jgi:hypothetical protein
LEGIKNLQIVGLIATKIWKKLVDESFGINYTRDHLEKGHTIK